MAKPLKMISLGWRLSRGALSKKKLAELKKQMDELKLSMITAGEDNT